MRRWDWMEGSYERIDHGSKKEGKTTAGRSDTASHSGGGGGGSSSTEGPSSSYSRTTRLHHLKIDRLRCHPSMIIQDGGLSLMQGPDKGWGVALSRRGFAKGTGTHRWTVRLDRVNRRGHVFLGVARRSVGLASFLGNDASGWGYLQSQDLYHGGSRKRSQYGEKMSQGGKIEVFLDSDQGTLSLGNADRGPVNFGIAFTDLYAGMPSSGPDSLIYPAFSLHHTQDLISIVSFDGMPADEDGQVMMMNGLMDEDEEDEEDEEMETSGRTTGLGGSIGGSLADPMASPTLAASVILGPPPTALILHTKALLETAITVLSPLVTLEEDDPTSQASVEQAVDHPIVSTLIPMALLALYRWQHFSPLDELMNDLCTVAKKLLQVIYA